MTTGFAQRTEEEQVAALTALARAALPAWGRAGAELSLLKYRENLVLRVDDACSGTAAMRVHRPRYRSDDQVRGEIAWIRALARDGFATPRVFDTQSGDVLTIAGSDGVPEPRQCDLIGWVAGRPLGSLEHGVDLEADGVREAYATIGELAAKLHEHANAWTLPAGFVRPTWGADDLVGDEPAFGKFWELDALDDEQRTLLLRARDRVHARLADLGPTRQLVHGDLIPDNVLVDGTSLSVIDFDDCGWSWPVFELATSVFPLLVSGGFDAGLEGFLAGYGSVRPFPENELDLLSSVLVARALSYLGWPVGRPEIHSQRLAIEAFATAAVEMVQASGA